MVIVVVLVMVMVEVVMVMVMEVVVVVGKVGVVAQLCQGSVLQDKIIAAICCTIRIQLATVIWALKWLLSA